MKVVRLSYLREWSTHSLLGSKVDKLSKILIKIWNVAEFLESDIQNIEAPRTDDPII